MSKTYEELGKEIEELMKGLPKHKPAPTSKQHEINKKRNPIKRPDAYVDENPSNKKRPCAPYGWKDCKSKYMTELKNVPGEGIYEFTPWDNTKYETRNDGEESIWVKLQDYLDGKLELTKVQKISYDFSIKLAEQKCKRLANYNEDGINVPEKMNAARLSFGSAKGHSKRFSCPKCWFNDGLKVTVNEYGYCPHGHGKVYTNSVHYGGAMRRMKAKPLPVPKAPVLIEEDLYEYTVRYTVNKKSDGRNPNGFLEVNAISDNLHRHYVPCVNKPRALYRPTSRIVKYGSITKEIWKVELQEPCECGCKVSAYDEKHGVSFCPKCGLVN